MRKLKQALPFIPVEYGLQVICLFRYPGNESTEKASRVAGSYMKTPEDFQRFMETYTRIDKLFKEPREGPMPAVIIRMALAEYLGN